LVPQKEKERPAGPDLRPLFQQNYEKEWRDKRERKSPTLQQERIGRGEGTVNATIDMGKRVKQEVKEGDVSSETSGGEKRAIKGRKGLG